MPNIPYITNISNISNINSMSFLGGIPEVISTASFFIEINESYFDPNVKSVELTDIPVVIDLKRLNLTSSTYDSFWNILDGGGHIKTYDSNGTTELARDERIYDTGSNEVLLVVKKTSLTGSSKQIKIEADSTFTTNYSDTDTYGAYNVYTNGYLGVYYFDEEVSGFVKNRAADNNHLTASNLTFGVAGPVGRGVALNGSNSSAYHQSGHTLNPSNLSIVAAVKVDTHDTGTEQDIIVRSSDTNNTGNFVLEFNLNPVGGYRDIVCYINGTTISWDNDTLQEYAPGTWGGFALQHTGSGGGESAFYYHNNSGATTVVVGATATTTSEPIYVWGRSSGADVTLGTGSMVRISETYQNDDYVYFEQNNIVNHDLVISVV